MRHATGWRQDWFHVEEWEVIVEDARDDERLSTQAIVRGRADGEPFHEIATGNGPVNALDAALRKAIGTRYPELDRIHLTDYKVRVLDTHKGTGAVTRVLVDSTDGEETCGGSPCSTSERLHSEANQLTINVIGLRVKNYAWMGDQGIIDAKCLAEKNGGQYLPVDTLAGLREALEKTLGCPMVTEATSSSSILVKR